MSKARKAVILFVLKFLRFLIYRVHGTFCFKNSRLHVPKGCFAPIFISTSLLLEAAVRVVRGRLGCEVGVGCGAVALSLIQRLRVEMVGTDIDAKCVRASAANAARSSVYAYYHPVVCAESRCLRNYSVDFAVTNPPYLPLDAEESIDLTICGGERLEVFRKMLFDALRVVRRGGVLVFTASSLTGKVEGAEAIGRRKTLFDTIYAYVYEKK